MEIIFPLRRVEIHKYTLVIFFVKIIRVCDDKKKNIAECSHGSSIIRIELKYFSKGRLKFENISGRDLLLAEFLFAILLLVGHRVYDVDMSLRSVFLDEGCCACGMCWHDALHNLLLTYPSHPSSKILATFIITARMCPKG